MAAPWSDYDLMIVLPSRDQPIIDALYDAAVQVLCETEKDISLKIYSHSDYQRLSAIPTPFMKTIHREGITLG